MRVPYTYLIGWSSLGVYYYGSRTARGCHPNDLWNGYYTSSKYVSSFRNEYGDPDILEVRRIFLDAASCIKWEKRVLVRMKVSVDNRWLNKSDGTCFDSTKNVGVLNPFYGKSHSEEAKIKAVERRLRNGNGDYFAGRMNPFSSDEVKRANSERMKEHNPMRLPEIKIKCQERRVATISSFPYWHQKYFLKLTTEYQRRTIYENLGKLNLKMLMSIGLKRDFSESILKKMTEDNYACYLSPR